MPDPMPPADIRPAVLLPSSAETRPQAPSPQIPAEIPDLEAFLAGLAAPSEPPQAAAGTAGETSKQVAEAKPAKTAAEVKAEIIAGFKDVSAESVAETVVQGAVAESESVIPDAVLYPIEEQVNRYAYAYAGVDGRGARAAGDGRTAIYTIHYDSATQPAYAGVRESLRILRVNQQIVDQTGQRLLNLREVLSGNLGAVVSSDLRAEMDVLDEAARAEIIGEYTRQTADDLTTIAVHSLSQPDAWGAGLAISHLPQIADRPEMKQAVAGLFVRFRGEPDAADENSRFNRALRTHKKLVEAVADKGIVIGRARVRTEGAGDTRVVKIEEDTNPPKPQRAGDVVRDVCSTLDRVLHDKRGNSAAVRSAMESSMKRNQGGDPFTVAWAASNPPEIKRASWY